MSDTCQRDSSLAEEINVLRANADRVRSQNEREQSARQAAFNIEKEKIVDIWFGQIISAIRTSSSIGKRTFNVELDNPILLLSDCECRSLAYQVKQKLLPYGVECDYNIIHANHEYTNQQYCDRMRFLVIY